MNESEVVALARRVACAAPETCDRVALGDLTRAVSQLRSVCDALDARIARRASELAAAGESEPAEAVVGMSGRRPLGEARAAVRRAGVCGRHESVAAALGDGEITGGHVDAEARARSGLDEAGRERFDAAVGQLVEDAKVMALDALARRCGWTARRSATDVGTARQEQLRRQRCVGSVASAAGSIPTRGCASPASARTRSPTSRCGR